MNLNNITINKQSSIKIAGDRNLYFDPFEIKKASNDADIIFVTHEHFDHYDIKSIAKIITDSTIVVAPETMKAKVIGDLGIAETSFMGLLPGDSREILGVSVEAVPAYNVGKPFHPQSNNWLGYLVTMDDTTYYVTGDTDANEDVSKVTCDVLLVPIGGKYTMDKDEAAKLVMAIKPKAVIPTHYGDVVGSPRDGKAFAKLITDKDIVVEIKL